MFQAVLLQVGATLIAAAIAGVVAGSQSAVSAALGGAAYFLPNLLFALLLRALALKGAVSRASAFLIGELVKIGLAIALLAAIHFMYSDVSWPALLCGLIVALQMNLFALLLKT